MSLGSLNDMAPVIDHQALLTRCLNRLDFVERMLRLFQDQCGMEVADLEQAFDQGDMNSVRRIAHRLAGASANAAAVGLQARAAELRHAADEGSLEKTSQCLVELQREWHRFTEARSADQKLSPPENPKIA
jgi:HPt (histidine-containing phosphotransfer) domain-containing protein